MTNQSKFVSYIRVSTARQGRSGLGLEAQRQAVAHYLNGGNWTIIAEFKEIESGRRADRPELDRALAAARLHRAPLVVAKVDRLTRSVAFLNRLLEAGVDVRFADLPTIEGPTGRFMLQQMASVAELEAGMISDRTRKALAASKKRLGGFRGRAGTPEDCAKARLVRTTKAKGRAADLAPVIAEIRTSGATSLRSLAAGLNERGITAPRGGLWSAAQVRAAIQAAG
jgi:DNA invertase Pin-like site-specific DNA recombinase